MPKAFADFGVKSLMDTYHEKKRVIEVLTKTSSNLGMQNVI